MTDKVQKIREEVQRLQNELIQEKEKGFGSDTDDACILELQNVLTYIDSLQKEEPVSIWHDASEKPNFKEKGSIFVITSLNGEYIGSRFYNSSDISCTIGIYDKWAYIKDLLNLSNVEIKKPVSEDLEEAAKRYATEGDEISGLYIIDEEVEAFKVGAKWQKENLWKPADGDDLPEYDREVVVLIKYNTQRNIHDEEYPTYRVGFGHRPNPDGWDGRNIDTNEATHYTPKLYDKGGWNAPNIVYWLDAELLKEIEL